MQAIQAEMKNKLLQDQISTYQNSQLEIQKKQLLLEGENNQLHRERNDYMRRTQGWHTPVRPITFSPA